MYEAFFFVIHLNFVSKNAYNYMRISDKSYIFFMYAYITVQYIRARKYCINYTFVMFKINTILLLFFFLILNVQPLHFALK